MLLAAVFLLAYLFARVQLAKAREDYADAFFYSPSLKTQQRRRRQRWQDRSWALLGLFLAALAAAAVLYLTRPAAPVAMRVSEAWAPLYRVSAAEWESVTARVARP